MRLHQFFCSHSIRIAPTLCLQGDVTPLIPTFVFFSSLTIYSAPAVTAGGILEYIWDISIKGRLGLYPDSTLP